MPADRLVIDLGNTRLKWGRADGEGRLSDVIASAIEDRMSWRSAIDRLVGEGRGPGSDVAIASVNPPVASVLQEMLVDLGLGPIRWFRSASDVPIRHAIDSPDQTGVDRALSVLAAILGSDRPGPGIVVQCGTAITVERVGPDGTWQGGAIAIGPGLASRALRSGTAQLPEARPISPGDPPPPWGASTLPALDAGIVWGAVGAIRELIDRQSEGLDPPPWIAWTGGDAPALAPLVDRPGTRVIPDLVLLGLASVAFNPGDAG